MCLIIQREKCCSPCVIEGESGVGKTALIKFLGKQIYNTELLIFNITAGTHESDLIAMVEKIKKASEALEKK
jgi:midasin (ATPase involved in ribosome maturation)